MRNHNTRLQKVASQIGSIPIPLSVVKEAFTRFQAEGVLPEDLRVAAAVLRRVTLGAVYSDAEAHGPDDILRWQALVRLAMETPLRPADEVMDALYAEAISPFDVVRDAARQALAWFSELGLDVTKPLFANRKVKLPDFGKVGLHLIGFPQCLAIPPYEEQAKRLFARYGELRERINQDNRRWFDAFGAAIGVFHEHSELPDDDLLRECVIADRELGCLLWHYRGVDVAELMAAFDAVATTTGPHREAALSHLGVVYARSREAA